MTSGVKVRTKRNVHAEYHIISL